MHRLGLLFPSNVFILPAFAIKLGRFLIVCVITLGTIFSVFPVFPAQASITKLLYFQGKLSKTSDGTNIANGSYSMRFKIYDALGSGSPPTGGNLLWTETWDGTSGSSQVTFTNGMFSVALGTYTPLSSLDFNTNAYYLSIDVNITGSYDGEMAPRQQLAASAFAFNANAAVGDGRLDLSYAPATDTYDGGKINYAPSVSSAKNSLHLVTGANVTGAGLYLSNAGSGVGLELAGAGAGSRVINSTGGALVLKTTSSGDITLDPQSGVVAGTGALTFRSANNGSGASLAATLTTGTGTTSTGNATIATGNASSGTAGNVVMDVGTSTSGNGSILIGTASRAQTITIGNSTGGAIRVGQNGGTLQLDGTNIDVDTSGTVTIAANQSYTGSGAVTVSSGGSSSLTIDSSSGRTAFATGDFLNTSVAGISGASSGDIWYDSTANKYKINENGTTKTLCNTIDAGCGAGGSSDLQTTYDNDADGSNTTLSLTAADDGLIFTNPSSNGTDSAAFLLQLSQAHTSANVMALDIAQLSNSANGVNVVANAIDTETGLSVTANAITSGRGLTVNSSTTGLTSTSAVVEFTLSGSNAANLGSVLKISNSGTASGSVGLFIDHRATGIANLAFRIDDASGDSTPFIVDGDGRVGIGTSSIAGTTERLLQIGSAANRGNLATYGEIITKGFKQIGSLANIKDMMIYDTTQDSDGGRWIDWADTEQNSWFTESLDDSASTPCVISSMDRCYSDAFPRKAILAVTSDAFYIFDATNGNMWMKFSQNAAGYGLGVDANNDPSSVSAQNGVIYVGTNGSAAGGLYVFDFVNDRMWNIDGTDRSGADVGIGSRNSAVTYNSDNTTALDIATVGTVADWGKINDVSVAVQKSSSTAVTISAVTNLLPNNGTTLVALATDSGITVINMNAQKVIQYSDATDNDYNSVVLTSRGRLYALNEALGQAERWNNIDTDKISEVNGTPDKVWDETTVPSLAKTAPTIIAGAPDALEVVERSSSSEETSDIVYVGHSLGLTQIDDNATNGNSGWSKFYTTTRQTAFMPATIRGMFPLDDASGNAADASIRTHVLAAKGTPTYGAQGVRGKAMSFNGTSQYLCSDTTGDGACDNDTGWNMGTTGWTFTAWFKHSTTQSGNDVLLDRCYNTTPAQAAACTVIWMNSSGNMVAAYDDDVTYTPYSSYDVTATSSLTYNDGQWHQVVLSRNNAGIINFYIDGNPVNLSTATASTLTLDAAQIVGIGADCSVGAACATGANFWDGSIDDITFSAGGTTTTDQMSAVQARRLYNDARPLVNKKVITVTDATTATSTTLGDSGESWIPQEFAGQIVTLTSGTGAGQTRRIVANTGTVLTVSPAFTTTPDTTTDFKMDPESLYGATNSVSAVGVSRQTLLGESRLLCAGTNSGTDTGGVTCFNHQSGPNLVADVYHADAKYLDDAATEWTGTDFDDIRAIDLTNRTMVIGSEAHTWFETQDVRLGQGLDYLQSKLFDVRGELINDGVTAAGSLGIEVGLTGGADLAEYYYANQTLEPGDVVGVDPSHPAGITKSHIRYQSNLLGVVSTNPALTIGPKADNAYAVALAGRIPVKVTDENGPIRAGDLLTASSRPGYAMRATYAGAIIGRVINEPEIMTGCDAPLPVLGSSALADGPGVTGAAQLENEGENKVARGAVADSDARGPQCGYAMLFIGLSQTLGSDVRELAREYATTHPRSSDMGGLATISNGQASAQEEILAFLRATKHERQESGSDVFSSIFTDRVSAAFEIITPLVVTENFQLFGEAVFFGRPYFNTDTAGFAVIKKGQKSVRIVFDKEYLDQPIVNATLSLNEAKEASDATQEKIAELQKAEDELTEKLFASGVQYFITKKNVHGFTILLNKALGEDVQFSWMALAVKNPRIFGAEEHSAKSETGIIDNNSAGPVAGVIGQSSTEKSEFDKETLSTDTSGGNVINTPADSASAPDETLFNILKVEQAPISFPTPSVERLEDFVEL